MSRGFNEFEKEVITNSLLEQGKILFSKFGFQKTSILEITKNVRIAQGTFYKFFHSKEELYFTILEMEEKIIIEQFAHMNLFKLNQPKKELKSILRQIIHIIETNPLIREFYFGSNSENMLRKLPPELLEKHFKQDSTSLLPLIEKMKNERMIIDEKPEVIAGVLRSLFVLTQHQKEIGIAVYQETIELLIDLVVDGLIKKEGK